MNNLPSPKYFRFISSGGSFEKTQANANKQETATVTSVTSKAIVSVIIETIFVFDDNFSQIHCKINSCQNSNSLASFMVWFRYTHSQSADASCKNLLRYLVWIVQ